VLTLSHGGSGIWTDEIFSSLFEHCQSGGNLGDQFHFGNAKPAVTLINLYALAVPAGQYGYYLDGYITLIGCNGINQNDGNNPTGNWAHVSSYSRVRFTACNIEDFTDYGIKAEDQSLIVLENSVFNSAGNYAPGSIACYFGLSEAGRMHQVLGDTRYFAGTGGSWKNGLPFHGNQPNIFQVGGSFNQVYGDPIGQQLAFNVPSITMAYDYPTYYLQINNQWLIAQTLAAAPGGVVGAIYADTVANHLYYYNGTSWAQLDNASFVAPALTSAPPSPAVGQIYANTTTNHLFYWNGSAWKQLDN